MSALRRPLKRLAQSRTPEASHIVSSWSQLADRAETVALEWEIVRRISSAVFMTNGPCVPPRLVDRLAGQDQHGGISIDCQRHVTAPPPRTRMNSRRFS